ncbi:methyltransferase, partial [uncultured Psychrobacter sp.]
MSHQPPAELLEKAKHWREDIHFTDDVLGKPFDFVTTWGIFSPQKLDDGSLMLLDHVDFQADDDSIDLGCGYGVLGMTAARECPNGQHTLIDKDFMAVEYARRNCEKNALSNVDVHLSNGFNQVAADKNFSLVMSNLPA